MVPELPAGQDPDAPLSALAAGTMLRGYEVVSVLGEGAFGITYLARDATLGREVAIKEYLPASLAIRRSDATVAPRSTACTEDFLWGRERFLDEARTLAKFDGVPGIVRVIDYLEANGTAYVVMGLVRGDTLRQRILKGGALSAPQIDRMLPPLLDGLEQVHAGGYLHRDIKPSNIILDGKGLPTLIDFGASRMAMADRTAVMTAVFTPGYAAPEQFVSMQQGPWTDIYGLSATLYHAIAGTQPPSAMERTLEDTYRPLAELAPAGFAPHLLAGIDVGMAVRPAERPQTIAAWRERLTDKPATRSDTVAVRRPEPPPAAIAADPVAPPARQRPLAKSRRLLWATVSAAVIGLAVAGWFAATAFEERRRAEAATIENKKQEQQRQAATEALKRSEDAAAQQQRQREESQARLKVETEARQKAEEAQRQQRAAEEAARRQRAEAAAAESRRREEEAQRQGAAAKKKADEAAAEAESRRRKQDEQWARLMADHDARLKAEEAPQQQAQKAVEEAARKAMPDAPSAAEQAVAPFDRAIRDWMAKYHVKQASIAVLREDRLIFAKGYNGRNVADRINVWGLSRTITGLCVAALIGEGKLRLDDKLGPLRRPYKPPEDARIDDIRIEDLLTHRSGFPTRFGDNAIAPGIVQLLQRVPLRSATADMLIPGILSQRLSFAPGSRFEHSNANYLLLGHVIEAATGVSYEDVCASRVLAPAGISGPKLDPSWGRLLGGMGGWSLSGPEYLAVLRTFRPRQPDPLTPEMRRWLWDPKWIHSRGEIGYSIGVWTRPATRDLWNRGGMNWGPLSLKLAAFAALSGDGTGWFASFDTVTYDPDPKPILELETALWDARKAVKSWPGTDSFAAYNVKPVAVQSIGRQRN